MEDGMVYSLMNLSTASINDLKQGSFGYPLASNKQTGTKIGQSTSNDGRVQGQQTAVAPNHPPYMAPQTAAKKASEPAM
jgi:hypothetical protein